MDRAAFVRAASSEKSQSFVECLAHELTDTGSTSTASDWEQLATRVQKWLDTNAKLAVDRQLDLLNQARPCGVTWKQLANSTEPTQLLADSIQV